MKNKSFYLIATFLLVLLTACGGNPEDRTSSVAVVQAPPAAAAPEDGTVIFTEPRKNYTLVHSPSSVLVTHNTTQVSSTHHGAKHLRFSDVSVNLMVAQSAKTIASKDLNSLIDLYIAFFNRVPDADGLNYWIDNLKAGATLEDIGANFYRVAKQYPEVTGYDEKMNDEAFVRLIYKNVLGRIGSTAPPDSHVAYWVNDLQKGLSKEKLVAVMSVAAREYANDKEWGWMTSLLNNKVALGKYFAIEQGLTYLTYEDSIRKTVTLTAAVTPTDYLKAKKLVEVKDSEFNLQTSSSSGLGKLIDCFNPAVFAIGNTILREDVQTKINIDVNNNPIKSISTTIEEAKVTGPVNFKGNSVLALVGTKTYRGDGLSDSVDSTTDYLSVEKDGYVSYGHTYNTHDSKNQNITILSYSLPADKLSFTLGVNETVSQSYIFYQENFLTGATISQNQSTQGTTFLGIEEITVPAGSFSACKIKYSSPSWMVGQPDVTTYVWWIASGPYRGLRVKILDSERWIIEASRLAINGK
ncbi:DUF4214 domain-containing protein [Undibacterium danionis]|uniref:DUF4214 domain-containing protein n=1 Tax=Undibacterium danionis TaxID=1812100 RepID=A0ABV6IFT1_9BURK